MTTTVDRDPPRIEAEKPRTSRHAELAGFILKYGGREMVDRLRVRRFLSPADGARQSQARAEELADDLEALGPTYIKFGQILSTRSDLLPEETLSQLARLQDDVEPMPFATVRDILEAELGRPLHDIFSSFEETPIGSASLGQVHAALLTDGRAVAVKIQRPGIRRVIDDDVAALHDFAGWFEKRTEVGRRYAVTSLVEEFRMALNRELDYELEAHNMARLKSNLREFPEIVVPSPIEELCTSRILTMDFVSGRKVSRIGPLIQLNLNGERLAEALLKAYLKQVFVDGFFHADPHPGNVFLVDSEHIALLDVGLVGYFAPSLRRKLLRMLPAIYECDVMEMVDLAAEIGEAEETYDRTELKRRFRDIVQKSQSGSIESIEVSRVLMDVVRAASDCGIRLPAEISTLGRTLLHLDKVGRFIAPGMDVNDCIRRNIGDIIRRQTLRDNRPRTLLRSAFEASDLVRQLPRRMNRVFESLLERRIGIRVDVVPEAHLLENLEKIANRITLGLVLAALIIGASQLMQVDTAFKILGYPGLAMICFAGAMVGGILLMLGIVRTDRRTRDEMRPGTRP